MKVREGKRPSRPESSSLVWTARGLTDTIWCLMEDGWKHDPAARPEMSKIVTRFTIEKPIDIRPVGPWAETSPMRMRNAEYARGGSIPLDILQEALKGEGRHNT